MSPSTSFILIFLFLFYFTPSPTLSDPRATKASLLCTNRTATSMPHRKIFISNFLSAMDSLTPLISTQRYGAVSKGTTQNAAVYAFAECFKDLSQSDCNVCIAQCKTQILSCLPFQKGTRGGKLFFDGCYLRYDDYNFFNESFSDQDTVLCSGNTTSNGDIVDVYRDSALKLVRNLSVLAPKNDGFSVGFVKRENVTVYGLAQCWRFINGSKCGECLEDAVSRIGSLCGKKEEARGLNSGCYLRYSGKKFYNNNSNGSDVIDGNHGEFWSLVLFLLRYWFFVAFIMLNFGPLIVWLYVKCFEN